MADALARPLRQLPPEGPAQPQTQPQTQQQPPKPQPQPQPQAQHAFQQHATSTLAEKNSSDAFLHSGESRSRTTSHSADPDRVHTMSTSVAKPPANEPWMNATSSVPFQSRYASNGYEDDDAADFFASLDDYISHCPRENQENFPPGSSVAASNTHGDSRSSFFSDTNKSYAAGNSIAPKSLGYNNNSALHPPVVPNYPSLNPPQQESPIRQGVFSSQIESPSSNVNAKLKLTASNSSFASDTEPFQASPSISFKSWTEQTSSPSIPFKTASESYTDLFGNSNDADEFDSLVAETYESSWDSTTSQKKYHSTGHLGSFSQTNTSFLNQNLSASFSDLNKRSLNFVEKDLNESNDDPHFLHNKVEDENVASVMYNNVPTNQQEYAVSSSSYQNQFQPSNFDAPENTYEGINFSNQSMGNEFESNYGVGFQTVEHQDSKLGEVVHAPQTEAFAQDQVAQWQTGADENNHWGYDSSGAQNWSDNYQENQTQGWEYANLEGTQQWEEGSTAQQWTDDSGEGNQWLDQYPGWYWDYQDGCWKETNNQSDYSSDFNQVDGNAITSVGDEAFMSNDPLSYSDKEVQTESSFTGPHSETLISNEPSSQPENKGQVESSIGTPDEDTTVLNDNLSYSEKEVHTESSFTAPDDGSIVPSDILSYSEKEVDTTSSFTSPGDGFIVPSDTLSYSEKEVHAESSTIDDVFMSKDTSYSEKVELFEPAFSAATDYNSNSEVLSLGESVKDDESLALMGERSSLVQDSSDNLIHSTNNLNIPANVQEELEDEATFQETMSEITEYESEKSDEKHSNETETIVLKDVTTSKAPELISSEYFDGSTSIPKQEFGIEHEHRNDWDEDETALFEEPALNVEFELNEKKTLVDSQHEKSDEFTEVTLDNTSENLTPEKSNRPSELLQDYHEVQNSTVNNSDHVEPFQKPHEPESILEKGLDAPSNEQIQESNEFFREENPLEEQQSNAFKYEGDSYDLHKENQGFGYYDYNNQTHDSYTQGEYDSSYSYAHEDDSQQAWNESYPGWYWDYQTGEWKQTETNEYDYGQSNEIQSNTPELGVPYVQEYAENSAGTIEELKAEPVNEIPQAKAIEAVSETVSVVNTHSEVALHAANSLVSETATEIVAPNELYNNQFQSNDILSRDVANNYDHYYSVDYQGNQYNNSVDPYVSGSFNDQSLDFAQTSFNQQQLGQQNYPNHMNFNDIYHQSIHPPTGFSEPSGSNSIPPTDQYQAHSQHEAKSLNLFHPPMHAVQPSPLNQNYDALNFGNSYPPFVPSSSPPKTNFIQNSHTLSNFKFIDTSSNSSPPLEQTLKFPRNSNEALKSSVGRPPHAFLSFGFGGILCISKPVKSAIMPFSGAPEFSAGPISIENFHLAIANSIRNSNCDGFYTSLLKDSFSSPLLDSGSTAVKDLNKWFDEKLSSPEETDHATLLKTLKLFWKSQGSFRNSPGQNTDPNKLDTKTENPLSTLLLGEESISSLVISPFNEKFSLELSEKSQAATILEIQNILINGTKSRALQLAKEKHSWGIALLLARHMSEETFMDTVADMACTQFLPGTPLRSLSLLLAGRSSQIFSSQQPNASNTTSGMPSRNSSSSLLSSTLSLVSRPSQSSISSPSPPSSSPIVDYTPLVIEKWKENIAIIASNRSPGDEKVITHIGDCLWRTKKKVECAHLCYLISERIPEKFSPSARLCLLGADHWKYPRTFVTPLAIQRTEILEFSHSFSASPSTITAFQPYKLVYACMLSEVGKIFEAQKYCLSVLKCLKHAARSVETEYIRQLASRLEERLKIRQQSANASANMGSKLVGGLMKVLDLGVNKIIGSVTSLNSLDADISISHSKSSLVSLSKNPSKESLDNVSLTSATKTQPWISGHNVPVYHKPNEVYEPVSQVNNSFATSNFGFNSVPPEYSSVLDPIPITQFQQYTQTHESPELATNHNYHHFDSTENTYYDQTHVSNSFENLPNGENPYPNLHYEEHTLESNNANSFSYTNDVGYNLQSHPYDSNSEDQRLQSHGIVDAENSTFINNPPNEKAYEMHDDLYYNSPNAYDESNSSMVHENPELNTFTHDVHFSSPVLVTSSLYTRDDVNEFFAASSTFDNESVESSNALVGEDAPAVIMADVDLSNPEPDLSADALDSTPFVTPLKEDRAKEHSVWKNERNECDDVKGESDEEYQDFFNSENNDRLLHPYDDSETKFAHASNDNGFISSASTNKMTDKKQEKESDNKRKSLSGFLGFGFSRSTLEDPKAKNVSESKSRPPSKQNSENTLEPLLEEESSQNNQMQDTISSSSSLTNLANSDASNAALLERSISQTRSVSEPELGRQRATNQFTSASSSSIASKSQALSEENKPNGIETEKKMKKEIHSSKNDKKNNTGSGMFRSVSSLFSRAISTIQIVPKTRQAKLGEENTFYYNEKLKRWVERGKEDSVEENALPPPPKSLGFVPTASSSSPSSSSSSSSTSSHPSSVSDSSLSNSVSTLNSKEQTSSTDKENQLDPASVPNSSTPPMLTPSSSSSSLFAPPLPPSKPGTSLAKRASVRSRYVDTFNKGQKDEPSQSFAYPLKSMPPKPAAVNFFVPSAPIPMAPSAPPSQDTASIDDNEKKSEEKIEQ